MYSPWKNNTKKYLIGKLGDIKDENSHCNNDAQYPTWFICDSGKTCQCGEGHNSAVVCDVNHLKSALMDCHCMTYINETKATYLGSCYYNCMNENIYRLLPKNPRLLINESACTRFNRAGLLCGDCERGCSPFVLSYNLSCIKCPDGHKNWWKVILVGLVPY